MTEQLAEEIFRQAGESIEVLTPPYDAVVARARERRRRLRRTVAASVAAGLVVVGAVTWVATRPEKTAEPAPTRVVPSRNPIDIAWYDGRLHLRAVAVELPDLTSVIGVGDGAAYIDTDGAVGLVAADGAVQLVGRAAPGAPILGSGENGWAAWLEPAGDGSRLVVWSVGVGDEVGSIVVSPETRLIAIDQDRVYAEGDDGAFAWRTTEAEPEQLDVGDLADVASATRVYQHGRRIEMVQPFFSVSFTRRGEGATVSPGGNFVLSRLPAPWVPGMPYTPLLYDTRSGNLLPSGVAADERVVDAAFGDNNRIDYLVADLRDLAGADLDGARSRLLVLRSCELETAVCHDVVPVRSAGDRAMFAP